MQEQMTVIKKFELSEAGSDDFSELHEIVNSVIEINYSFLSEDHSQYYKDYIVKNLNRNENKVYLYKGDNKTVGFAIVNDNTLKFIVIIPECQNMGYGTEFLISVEDILFEKFENIELDTIKESDAVNEFYLKNDWTITGEDFSDEYHIFILKYIKQRPADKAPKKTEESDESAE